MEQTTPNSLGKALQVSTALSLKDRMGSILCRISGLRSHYTVSPGLYATGRPDEKSPVFVSANYKLSFDLLRQGLHGLDAWIIVLDTNGINVWCAAGKGVFGTAELVRLIGQTGLHRLVSHRRIIVPQLGAPGVAAHEVQRATGFRVSFGPVRAADIEAYMKAGCQATKKMRTVEFSLMDRLVLTPMEIIPAMKLYLLYAGLMMIFSGLQPTGILFTHALTGGLTFGLPGLVAVLAGAFFMPLLLPWLPTRSFAVKGWVTGVLLILLFFQAFPYYKNMDPVLALFFWIFYPAASSYIGLQFTGSTPFTGMSGVKKELRYAIAFYVACVAVSVLLLLYYKIHHWGVS